METARLSCTVFEILSLICQKLKRSRDSDHAPFSDHASRIRTGHFRDGLSSVEWDLICSTHIPNLKYLRLPATTIIKGNAKCKNSRFGPAFGDLLITQRVHLWLDGKRIVDFLLVIVQLFC